MMTHCQCCKHVSALLLSLFTLKNFHNVLEMPKIFCWPNIKCFAQACAQLKEKIDYDLTWKEILKQMLTTPPKKHAYSASYDTFQTEYVPCKKVQKSSKEPEYLKWSCALLREKLREKGENFFGKREILCERWKTLKDKESVNCERDCEE